MSGYDEIGAGCFADGYIAAGGTRDMYPGKAFTTGMYQRTVRAQM